MIRYDSQGNPIVDPSAYQIGPQGGYMRNAPYQNESPPSSGSLEMLAPLLTSMAVKKGAGLAASALPSAGIWGALGSVGGVPVLPVAGGAAALYGLSKLFDKPSVKEQVDKRWSGLAGSEDPTTAAYAQQYGNYLKSDQQKADAKKEGGKWTPEDVWGGYGMFDTFGSDWLNKYSEGQRREISQKLLDANLIESKKGDLIITDPAKAKEIAAGVPGSIGGAAAQKTPQGPGRRRPRRRPQAVEEAPVAAPPVAANPTGPTQDEIAQAFANVYLANGSPTGNNNLLENPILQRPGSRWSSY